MHVSNIARKTLVILSCKVLKCYFLDEGSSGHIWSPYKCRITFPTKTTPTNSFLKSPNTFEKFGAKFWPSPQEKCRGCTRSEESPCFVRCEDERVRTTTQSARKPYTPPFFERDNLRNELVGVVLLGKVVRNLYGD